MTQRGKVTGRQTQRIGDRVTQTEKVTGRQTERHGDRESHRETWCQGDT